MRRNDSELNRKDRIGMGYSKVVVLGCPGSGKKEILRGIQVLQRYRKDGVVDDQICVLPTESKLSIELSTKYYTAKLQFHILPNDELVEPTSKSESILEDAEAIIIVLDASRDGPDFHLASQWVGKYLHGLNLDTMLLISNKCDLSSSGYIPGMNQESPGGADLKLATIAVDQSSAEASTEHFARMERNALWSIDNGLEHVECSALHPLAGIESREKQGIARILEALESTMWSSMVKPKSALTSKAMEISREHTSQISPKPPLGEKEIDDQPKSEVVPINSGSCDNEECSRPSDALEKKTSDAEKSLDSLFRPLDIDSIFGEGDGDLDIGKLMQQMRMTKERAQTGNLSDEERRRAAADMAMRLMSMLNFGEDEEQDQ